MINIAIIQGRLVNDPDLRSTPSGTLVAAFTVAVPRKKSGQGEEQITDFIDCVAWRQTAEFVERYFHKGNMIAVQGSVQTQSFENRSGVRQKKTELLVKEVSFCGDKPKEQPKKADDKPKTLSYDFEPIDDDDDDNLPF
jgi:single-strand DNA-binding protein